MLKFELSLIRLVQSMWIFLLWTFPPLVRCYTQIATVAGGTGTGGDGTAATSASLNSPFSVALDTTGVLYISEAGTSKIRAVAVGT